MYCINNTFSTLIGTSTVPLIVVIIHIKAIHQLDGMTICKNPGMSNLEQTAFTLANALCFQIHARAQALAAIGCEKQPH